MIIRTRSARSRRWNKLDRRTYAAAPCASLSGMLKQAVDVVLASLRASTYRFHWRPSTFPLAFDRSERLKRSLICTFSALRLSRPCLRREASRRVGSGG